VRDLSTARARQPDIPAIPAAVQVPAPLVVSDEGTKAARVPGMGRGDYHSPGTSVRAPKWVALRYFRFGPRGSMVSRRRVGDLTPPVMRGVALVQADLVATYRRCTRNLARPGRQDHEDRGPNTRLLTLCLIRKQGN
jgi:hypothetical protein